MRSDFLVIGGEVIGVNIVRAMRRTFSGASVHLLEKDPDCGLHASVRNSGFPHAGFYYPPYNLKAKLTWRGTRLLTEFCEEKKIPLNKCGKLVVAKDHTNHAGLDERLRWGCANGIPPDSGDAGRSRRVRYIVNADDHCEVVGT